MWEPLSATNGVFVRGEDTVTVLAASSGPVQFVDFDSTPDELVERLAKTMSVAYAPQIPHINQCLLLVSPEHYDTFLKAGLDSKDKLAKALWQRMGKHMLPHIEYLLEKVKPNMPALVRKLLAFVIRVVGTFMSMLGFPFNLIPKFSSPASLKIVVAGGTAGKFSAFMPGFGVGLAGMPTANMSTPVTVKVEPRPPSLDTVVAKDANGDAVLDPVPDASHTPTLLVKRSGVMAGPVALMDISKARGSELLDIYEARLKASGLETRRYAKPTFSRPAPEALLRTIAAECKTAILGLAD